MVDKPRGYVSSVSETALDLTRIRDFALRIRHTNCCYSYGMPCPEGPRRGPKVMPGGNGPAPSAELVGSLDCPVLVIHGTKDRISPYSTAVEAARLTGGSLFTMEGSGHIPNVRDPVAVNLAMRDFIERIQA